LNCIAKLKIYISPGSNQIPGELIEARVETLVSVIHKLTNPIWNKEELPAQWKLSIILPLHKKGYKSDCNNYRDYHCLQLHTNCYEISSFHS
jgi:hypothetical protein